MDRLPKLAASKCQMYGFTESCMVEQEVYVKSFRIVLPIVFATVAGFLAIMIATPVHAQNQALLGKWDMTSTAPQYDVSWTLTIDYKDGKYAATSSTGEGAGPVNDL